LRKVVYLTFNDGPGGIFTSQVVDVCRFLHDELKLEVQLISFISLRGFFAGRKKIREQFPGAIVLPMWPGVQNWRRNRLVLRRKLSGIAPDTIIARGPIAAVLAGDGATGARICFDARAAYAAEYSEFNVAGGKITAAEMESIEREALQNCDCAIAVSAALVGYWKSTYGYSGNKHVVIPCTFIDSSRVELRKNDNAATRIVFAGGNGKWQSTELISEMLEPLFANDPRIELVMLSRPLPHPFPLAEKYPSRVSFRWVKESAVHQELMQCDYGWMFRSSSVTNRVASPVKFAEYLRAGLNVIVSPGLGDFSEFVGSHNCGIIIKENKVPPLLPLTAEQRTRNSELARQYFTKKAYIDEYKFCVG